MKPDRAWLLTPPGPGAIAVIRLSGPGVSRALTAHFSKPLRSLRCVHGELRDESGTVIDDPVIVLLDEQTADISVHGGGAIIRAVLSFAERAGFRLEAPPLDTSVSDDLIEQEMHAALPLARTHLGLATLLSQPRAWRGTTWIAEQLDETLSDRSLHWLLHPPTVAIVGIPNAGKSTLANQLFGQDRSIVFDRPGTTRDWVGEYADVDGLPIMLIDTPGIRESLEPIETIAIRQSREQLRSADLVLLLLDATQPQPAQAALIAEFPSAIRIANKVELTPSWKVDDPAHRIVAKSGEGIDELRAAIRRYFLGDGTLSDRALLWTDRQRASLQRHRALIV